MSFNLVLDEPAAGDIIEEHDGYKFIVESKLFDNYGPFTLSSIKHGTQTFLQLNAAKAAENGGCSTCSSCE